jgi:hypothetical protein
LIFNETTSLLNKWLNWTSFERRCFYALGWGIAFYIIGNILFLFLGATHVPYRGENQGLLNALLTQSFLI